MSENIGPSNILHERSLAGVARYMQSEKCKNVFVLTGAGISTAAGIPDFRSPDTGLYANLARLDLPYPEAVFDIHFFRANPLPFYTLAHELAPGRYRPTLTHSFIRLLNEKGLLHTCFTQNIDTLERKAGLPSHRIIEAHGSFASQRCIDCETPFDDDKMKRAMKEKTVPKCGLCGGLVKPNIVFFGEALPPEFHRSIRTLVRADLLIIIGTSLMVHPFACLTGLVPEKCPRILINMDPVGDIGDRPDDVVMVGKCDEVIQRLCKLLQWEKELDTLWDATKDSVEQDEDTSGVPPRSVDEEVQKLTEEVEKTLKLSAKLTESTEKLVKRDETKISPDNGDQVLSQSKTDGKETQDMVMTKPAVDTGRTEADKQDGRLDDGQGTDTDPKHTQGTRNTQDIGDTQDVGDTHDNDGKVGKL